MELASEQPSLLATLSKSDAQVAIDEIWKLLDSTPLPIVQGFSDGRRRFRLRHLALLVATTHGVLPTALVLAGVERLDTEERISGGFADIFYGKLRGQAVAIKRLQAFRMVSETARPELRQAFYRECLLWKGLDHEHVLQFWGVSEDLFQSTICIISPWMENGRLKDYIIRLLNDGKLPGPSYSAAINKWLREVAFGLEYLHSEQIVHGDLHGGNILIDAHEKVKLTDFGMSVVADGTPYAHGSIHGGGAIRWAAPELVAPENFGLDNRRPTSCSDVYSFGCVCVELYTRQPPYADLDRDYQIWSRVLSGGRPPRPTLPDGGQVSNDIWSLMSSSWAHIPSERPSAQTLVGTLSVIIDGPRHEARVSSSYANPTIDSARHTVPPRPLQMAKALWSYNKNDVAHDFRDLTFSAGEYVRITERMNEDWYKGICRGREGIFPSNRVELVMNSHEPSSLARASVDTQPPSSQPRIQIQSKRNPGFAGEFMGPRSVPQSRSRVARALWSYDEGATGHGPSDLTFSVGEFIEGIENINNNWSKGTCRGREGIFPSSYVEIVSDPSPSSATHSQMARAIWPYDEEDEGRESTDLKFAAGDYIEIVEKIDANWMKGKCKGKEGLFPVTRVEILGDATG